MLGLLQIRQQALPPGPPVRKKGRSRLVPHRRGSIGSNIPALVGRRRILPF